MAFALMWNLSTSKKSKFSVLREGKPIAKHFAPNGNTFNASKSMVKHAVLAVCLQHHMELNVFNSLGRISYVILMPFQAA
jgi:hypothetical protein